MKKNVILVLGVLLLALTAFAKLPPRYLEIKDFEQCLGTRDMCGMKSWCMPTEKPDACEEESWEELNALTGDDRLPSC